MAELEKLRVDKWLWAARFYKTRALAVQAVSGGHVHVDGVRVKPSKAIAVGSRLTVTKAPYAFHLTVLGLSDKRGPASVAQTLYEESAESQSAREKIQQQRREQRLMSEPSQNVSKPNKRDRRMIHRFRRVDSSQGS